MTRLIARSARFRGILVVVAAGTLVAASAAIAGVARSSPSLPAIAPQRLVANMIRIAATDPSLSGTLTAHLGLGLPDLPDEGPRPTTGPAAIVDSLSGDHRLRVWHSRDGARISDLLPTGERAIVVSRTQAWLWDSTTMTVVRLGSGADPGAEAAARTAASLIDPVALSRRALEALDPSTLVTVAGTTSIAGRDAYVLTLTPRTDATLVGRVELYVDASRWLPLGGAIFARGSTTAAVSAKFTQVSFDAVDPAVFDFTPPPGSKVITPGGAKSAASVDCPSWMDCPVSPPVASGPVGRTTHHAPSGVRVFGKGWATVVAVRTPSAGQLEEALAGDGFDPIGLLPFSGTLFSIRMAGADSGSWLLFGMVPQSALQHAAAELS